MQNLSREALEVAKRISHIIWQVRYQDSVGSYLPEKLSKNESVRTDIPANMDFFFGQFDALNQSTFIDMVNALPGGKVKEELDSYVTNYYHF